MPEVLSEEEVFFSDDDAKFEDNEIHVRKQNRRGRKWLTTIENIPDSCDMTKILNALKRDLCCNGTIVTDPEKDKKIIQMQGDHGSKVQQILEEIFPNYKVHFFGS